MIARHTTNTLLFSRLCSPYDTSTTTVVRVRGGSVGDWDMSWKPGHPFNMRICLPVHAPSLTYFGPASTGNAWGRSGCQLGVEPLRPACERPDARKRGHGAWPRGCPSVHFAARSLLRNSIQTTLCLSSPNFSAVMFFVSMRVVWRCQCR